MLVYVWARRNPYLRMNFFGLLNFQVSEILNELVSLSNELEVRNYEYDFCMHKNAIKLNLILKNSY